MEFYPIGEKVAIRKAFGKALLEVFRENDQVLALTGDLASSLGMDKIGEEFPERFFNVGVAEQDLIGIAAGLALQGFIPFAGTFGSFLGRTMDHVRQSVGHNGVNVKIVGSHGGVSNAKDGPSAHALEDLAMFRALPKMAVVVPADANQTLKAVAAVAAYPTSVYLRLYREPLPVFTDKNTPFEIGRADVIREGSDVSVIAVGPHVGFSLEVAAELADNIAVEVINCHTLAPIDAETIIASAKKTEAVVTVEDHNIHGGLGSAVAEVLSENLPTRMVRVALRDFAASGAYLDVINAAGIGKKDIREAIKRLIRQQGVRK
jgi:transketolase